LNGKAQLADGLEFAHRLIEYERHRGIRGQAAVIKGFAAPFPDRLAVPRGRSPDSPEWYHGANLILRSDACLIGARYRQLRNQGLAAGEALVFAYRAYQAAGDLRGAARSLLNVNTPEEMAKAEGRMREATR